MLICISLEPSLFVCRSLLLLFRDGTYDKLTRDMIEQKGSRLVVSINDLRNSNPERAKALLSKSFEEVSAFQRALKEFVGSIDATFAKETSEFFIGLEGSFGSKHVTPRYSNELPYHGN